MLRRSLLQFAWRDSYNTTRKPFDLGKSQDGKRVVKGGSGKGGKSE